MLIPCNSHTISPRGTPDREYLNINYLNQRNDDLTKTQSATKSKYKYKNKFFQNISRFYILGRI
jgi:hypothetical protein